MTAPKFTWTDETVDRLRLLASTGIPASAIAVELCAPSRNAVIGKCHRLRIKLGVKHDPAPARPPVERRASPKPIPALRPIETTRALRQPRVVVCCEAVAVPSDVVPATAVTLADVRAGDCRWPYNEGADFVFCGAPVRPGSSWCECHRAIGYRSAA